MLLIKKDSFDTREFNYYFSKTWSRYLFVEKLCSKLNETPPPPLATVSSGSSSPFELCLMFHRSVELAWTEGQGQVYTQQDYWTSNRELQNKELRKRGHPHEAALYQLIFKLPSTDRQQEGGWIKYSHFQSGLWYRVGKTWRQVR
jgi:hypothetical protein